MGILKKIRQSFWPEKERQELIGKIRQLGQLARIHGKYDAAQTTDEYKNYWANTDNFSADAAHSRHVRQTLVKRSRYEITSNGISDGIASTYATDLIGAGPQLRTLTGNKAFNRLVNNEFFYWSEAVHLRSKLRTMAHAKHVDGEAFAVLRRNPMVDHPVKLDVCLHETEQCQTPMLPAGEPGKIDGIEFDIYGNPTVYHFLNQHPGDGYPLDWIPERIPANLVLHWFKLRRPGQHRGVPECSSTLNLGAAFRRLREASLSTAEKVAAWTLFMETIADPDEDDAQFSVPMSTLEIVHGMLTALPNGAKPHQLTAEQPGPEYDTFHKSLANEQGRPKSMPLNKILCNSADYNYASGRLDHQTYYGSLDDDRLDGNDFVLNKIHRVWYDLAISRFMWFGGDPAIVGPGARAHTWAWPKHRVADVEAEANADDTRCKTGVVSLPKLMAEKGDDADDADEEEAAYYGITVKELRARKLDVTYPPPKQLAGPAPAKKVAPSSTRLAALNGFNGNGANHG